MQYRVNIPFQHKYGYIRDEKGQHELTGQRAANFGWDLGAT